MFLSFRAHVSSESSSGSSKTEAKVRRGPGRPKKDTPKEARREGSDVFLPEGLDWKFHFRD